MSRFKLKLKMPQAFTILVILIAVMAVLTWIIPAGQYDRITTSTGEEPVAGSYHLVERAGQGPGDVLLAPFEGFYNAVDIAVFILVVGSFLGIINKTGALKSGIFNILRIMKGREKLMIPILMSLFALGGTTFGMSEETIAFYALILPIFITAGYDAVTAVAVIMLGAGIGVFASTVNPFATGIAAGFAGVSIGDGILLRLAMFAVGLAITIIFVMRYAEKVKKDPSKSFVADLYHENKKAFANNNEEAPALTGRRKLVLTLFAITFIVMIYSVIPFGDMGIRGIPSLNWWFPELSALFLAMGVLTGIVYGLKETEIIDGIVVGAADLLGVAFIIGISRGITVIMNNGIITDTILYYGETLLSGLHSGIFILLNYLVFIPLSVLIPSSSGLATLAMPVLAPLADFANVGRSLVITAFQSASGIVNLITPTSAVVMGGLAIGHVPYGRWIRFVWKYLIIIALIAGLMLVLAAI
ncbi:MAG: YfcC family protein [Firmicutes bacterium]|nr:YfcC family protein [Bacillota bacterium]